MVSAETRAEIRSMSKADLEEVGQYMVNRWRQLEIDAVAHLSIGQTVRFNHKDRTISGPLK